MTAKIIDGKRIAQEIETELAAEVRTLKEKGVIPKLAAVLVGDDPASKTYVASKERLCAALGMISETHALPEATEGCELIALIQSLNRREDLHGVIVQLPLPEQINEGRVIEAISPEKDVDGFHPLNIGRILSGEEGFLPATPQGIVELLVRSGNPPNGKDVVIVGRSRIVGRPLANLLTRKGVDATVTLCHTMTKDLAAHARRADILIAAMGRPRSITEDMVKEGAVVVDVGVNRVPDPGAKRGYRLAGDVDFDAVVRKASAITPVPGGVGPMTVIMLMKNTVRAARLASGM
ncbi:MAG: tetrahydrofolate dehydrogenase/cyclohydrolase catalytic domain-containing protein [Candidatus Thermoplasmatota archaeon]